MRNCTESGGDYSVKSSVIGKNLSVFMSGDICVGMLHDLLELIASPGVSACEKVSLHITSPGGDMDAGRAIYDAIITGFSDCEVTTFGWGDVCSCAVFPLLAGSTRFLNYGGTIMLHEPTISMGGMTLETVCAWETDFHRHVDWHLDLLWSFLGGRDYDLEGPHTRGELAESLMGRDIVLSPEKSLRWGLITGIMGK